MTVSPDPAPTALEEQERRGADYVRGSTLLVVGRVVAQLADISLLIVLARYLTQGDYGALTYALAIVILFKTFAVFELPNTLGRFLPLYREQGQQDKLRGAITAGLIIVVGLGVTIGLALAGAVLFLGWQPAHDSTASRMVVILAFLVPLEALDTLIMSLFAVIAGARAIFVRQAVLAPALKLSLLTFAVTTHPRVEVLGVGYVVVGAIGVAMFGMMFRKTLTGHSAIPGRAPELRVYPFRELVGFSAPLLASTLVWSLMESSDAVLLGHFRGTSDVALFRAVMPIAVLNSGVILTFGVLYTPAVAALYARGRSVDISDLYWRSAAWVTVLSYPLFLFTFSFSRSATTGLLGQKYAASAPIMSLLAFGYFFHTALGYNGLTLRIFRKLRYTVSIDLLAAVLNVAINLVLIPPFGALGAAVGTSATLVIHNVLKQWGLRHYTGIPFIDGERLALYAFLFGSAGLLLGLQFLLPVKLWVSVPIATIAGIAAIRVSHATLEIATTFPELGRIPLVRRLVGLPQPL